MTLKSYLHIIFLRVEPSSFMTPHEDYVFVVIFNLLTDADTATISKAVFISHDEALGFLRTFWNSWHNHPLGLTASGLKPNLQFNLLIGAPDSNLFHLM